MHCPFFYRRLPTTTLSTSACRLCEFCCSPRLFSTHMVHVVVSDGHVLPWKLSKISRPSRQAFHSHCGRAKGASASASIDQSCGCWGVRTAVGDNDPGSVGAPALLGSAVEPETSLQIAEQQQKEEVMRSCPRNPSGGRAQRRRRGTFFHAAVRIAFSSTGPFYSAVATVEMDGAILPTFPPIREPSFRQRNQATLGSNPRHPFNQVFPPPPVVVIIYNSCP